jgi:hypothetical protein
VTVKLQRPGLFYLINIVVHAAMRLLVGARVIVQILLFVYIYRRTSFALLLSLDKSTYSFLTLLLS